MVSIDAITTQVHETMATAANQAKNGDVKDANLHLIVMCDIITEYMQETITRKRYATLKKMWGWLHDYTRHTDQISEMFGAVSHP